MFFGEGFVKHVNTPGLITDRLKVVVLLWLYVACLGARVSVMFQLTSVHIILVRFVLLSCHLIGNS